MVATKALLPWAIVLGALGAPPGEAQIYKWSDERGVVQYSNVPPPRSAGRLDADERVTVYSTRPLDPAPEQDTRSLRQRIDALEYALEAERRERELLVQADTERRRREIEECERQRRVDCDKPEVIENGPPVVIVPPRKRSAVVPTLPVPQKAVPAPAPKSEKEARASRRPG